MDFILSLLYMENLVKTEERKIRQALEEAKRQNVIWSSQIPKPPISNKDLIAPADAYRYLNQCRESVETRLIERAQRFSPVQWLWYLRRFPNIHYIEDEGFEGYCLTLAEILSARSQRGDASEQLDTQLSFPLTPAIADYVLAFVAGVYDLGDLHIKIGAAARDIPFRLKPRGFLDPVVTKSKREAGKVYDARQRIDLSSITGTIQSQRNAIEKLHLYGVHRTYYPSSLPLPFYETRSLETPPIIPTYYLPVPVPLKHIADLYQLTNNGNQEWLSRDVFSLMVMAGVLLPISASAPEASINIAMYGYSVHERSAFITHSWHVFDEIVLILKKLFPGAEFPSTPIQLLDDLESLSISTYPITPNVIRGNGRWIVIDHASVQHRLGQLLRFPNLGGRTGNQRGSHFEDAVQSYIDASRWQPSPELRAMRRVHLVRRGDGKNSTITDIDAVGALGDTLLIVSCKAIIFSVGQDLGDSHALRIAQLKLDEAVRKWQAVKAELLDSPVGHNYDVSHYTKIIAIVCTPNTVYTESDQSLAYEVQNLRKAATAGEFIDWLNS